jgi:protein-L-isoaspartate(D-aspartate) O-methyltransferase
MVNEQLRARGITDERVLKAFLAVPRHRFVDAAVGSRAYDDCSFPIGYDQTISQPYTIAFMVQSLGVERLHRVLEVGTGSGYQTAILSLLAHDVFSVERLAALLKKAETALAGIRTGSIRVKTADGALGWASYAPFDRGGAGSRASPRSPTAGGSSRPSARAPNASFFSRSRTDASRSSGSRDARSCPC